MIKYIRYKENCFKFHKGVNILHNFDEVDYAGTIFGGFTSYFKHGNGRRLDVPADEVEVSMSCCTSFNKKTFNFTRVYTDSRTDTEEFDKRQDIVRYAKKCEKNITENKEEVIFPLICYYNNETKFNNLVAVLSNVDSVTSRDYGYNNCLIVYNKFDAAQQYFAVSSYLAWQHDINKSNKHFVKKYKTTLKYINDIIGKIGYSDFKYNLVKQSITVLKNGEEICLKDIENKDEQIYICIVFDVFVRNLMLNMNQSINVEDTEGVVVISYNFEDNRMLDNLVSSIHNRLDNVQIIVYNK